MDTERAHRLGVIVVTVILIGLTVSAVIVQASSHEQLVVGSQHSTDTDFQAAETLDNVTVDGSGESARVLFLSDQTIDDFEDGDISEYTGDTGSFTVTTDAPVSEGSYSLKSSTTSYDDIFSTSGLPAYPSQGDTFSVQTQIASGTGSEVSQFLFGGPDFDNTYLLDLDAANDEVFLNKRVSGSGSPLHIDSSAPIPADEWLTITIEWGEDDSIAVTVEDDAGTELSSFSVSDAEYTSGGVGFRGNGDIAWDDAGFNEEPNTGQYVSQPHNVSNAEQAALNVTVFENVSATASLEYHDGTNWQVGNSTALSGVANHTIELPDVSADRWRANVSIDSTGDASEFALADESILFTDHAPTVDNSSASPSGGEVLTESPDEVSINITDPEFDTAQGDEVTVTFYDADDDSEIGSDVLTENGTATAEWSDADLGEREWYVVAEDDYGLKTTSDTSTFVTPSGLAIREEHDPQQLVNNTTVTLRFYTVEGEIAIQRESSDGSISMEGLPDSEFVVFAEAEGYYDRRIYIESIFEQEDVFLLNETEFPREDGEAILSRFIYEDLTGEFPREDTTLQIERSIDLNDDGQSEYMTVAGDYWGASNEFEVVLEHGVRYRLVLVNRETGERHIAGTHIPTTELTQSVRVTGLVQDAANASGVYANAELNTSEQTIELVYRDPADETTDLRILVKSQDGEEELLNETLAGPLGSYVKTVDLNESQAEQDWVVRFESDRHQSAVPVGSGSVGLPMAVPSWLLTLLGSMAVTFVGALYGPRTAIMGAWGMVFVAAGIAMFGWAFSGPSVIVAALVAVGVTLMSKAMP